VKVFVSHSAKDKAFVEEHVVDFLEQNGVATWYSPDDIDSAAEWERTTRQALDECDWFLVVLTPNSVASSWVRAEVHWAMENRADRVVPVLAEPCDWQDLHLMLRTLQLVLLNENLEEGKSRLLAIWEKQLRPVVCQKADNQLLDEPVLAIVEACVSTMVYDAVAVGITRAVSLKKRSEAELPESLANGERSELASVRSSRDSVEFLFSSGELFTLYFHVDQSWVLECIGGDGQKYELPAQASCSCEVYRSLHFRGGPDRLIGCTDGTLCVFEPRTTKDPVQLISHHSRLSTLATSTRSVLASGDVEGCVNIWSQTELQQQGTVDLRAPVHSMIVDSRHSQFVASVGDGELCTFDYQGKVSTRVKVASRPITQLISISDALIVFSTGEKFGLWDLKQGKVTGNYQLESKSISALIPRKDPMVDSAFLLGCDDGSLVEFTVLNPTSPHGRARLRSS
jgi:hypothetical protein